MIFDAMEVRSARMTVSECARIALYWWDGARDRPARAERRTCEEAVSETLAQEAFNGSRCTDGRATSGSTNSERVLCGAHSACIS